jgi:predicted HTH transcriptional regulator
LEFFDRLKQLPLRGETIERATRDLKGGRTTPDPTNAFELAKDVAAFANHLGGELLVGANEVDGVVGEYEGLPLPLANTLREQYSKAVKRRCLPRPLFDFDLFPAPNDNQKHVLVVYVAPYVGGSSSVSLSWATNRATNTRATRTCSPYGSERTLPG